MSMKARPTVIPIGLSAPVKKKDIYELVEAQQRRLSKVEQRKYADMQAKYLPVFQHNMKVIKDEFNFTIDDTLLLLGEADSLKVGHLLFILVGTNNTTGKTFKVYFSKPIALSSKPSMKSLNTCFNNSPSFKKSLPKQTSEVNKDTPPHKSLRDITPLQAFDKIVNTAEKGHTLDNTKIDYLFEKVMCVLKQSKALSKKHEKMLPLDLYFMQDDLRPILESQSFQSTH
ncbi:hypothetical protein ACJ5M8_000700 [Vibrio antiquarius]